MINELIRLLAKFLLLSLVQIAILNQIQLSGFVNPFIYILFILSLPVKYPRSAVLLMAFITGLIIDTFSNTMGMHAAACVVMAFVRPAFLKIMAPRDGYDTDTTLSARKLGFTWFLTYAALLTLVHHLVLFYVEVFRFSEFFTTFSRVILSALASLTVIMIAQYLSGKPLNVK